MGEIADLILNGDLCEGCGAYMENGGNGYPVYCASCQWERGVDEHGITKPSPEKVKCPTCGKLVKKAGLAMHHKDVHDVFISDKKHNERQNP